VEASDNDSLQVLAEKIAQISGFVSSYWFGDASDGDVVISENTQIPVEEDLGHIFKQYNSLTINEGCTLEPSGRCAGAVFLVKGDCRIDGIINLDKKAPRRSDTTENIILTSGLSSAWLQKASAITGGKGGNGGAGRYGTGGTQVLQGGTGGTGHRFGGGFGAGGSGGLTSSASNDIATSRQGASCEPRPPATASPWPPPSSSSRSVAPLYGAGGAGVAGSVGVYPGGTGPGAAGRTENIALPNGNGDAYGGGLLMLVVGGQLIINGKITAKGGPGGSTNGNSSGNGGGGGGGIIVVLTQTPPIITGSLTVDGGSAGTYATTATPPATNGSEGTAFIAQMDTEGVVSAWS
jgi:hypothetical protein